MIALIVGHTEYRGGALAYNGVSEFSYNSEIAEMCAGLSKNITVFHRKSNAPYKWSIREVMDRVKFINPKIIIELHFNAYNKVDIIEGCEGLILNGDQLSHILVGNLYKDMNHYFNIGSRHIKQVVTPNRGYYSLKQMALTNAKYKCIFEPCFMDVKHRESELLMTKKELYAERIVNVCKRLL